MTSHHESPLEEFLASLGARRARLEELTGGPDEGAGFELITEIAELTEQLLVADEELRTQHDELTRAQETAQALLKSWESMFVGAPIAYLLTDVHGVLTNANRAARRLFGDTGVTRVRPIATKFALADRRAIRTLIDQARTVPSTIQCTGLRRDGSRIRVAVTATPLPATDDTPASLWWQIRPIAEQATPAAEQSVDDTGQPAGTGEHAGLSADEPVGAAEKPSGVPPDASAPGMADPFADLELLGRFADGLKAGASAEALVRALLARALDAFPDADAAGVFLSNRKDGVWPTVDLGQLAQLATVVQQRVDSSPIRDAITGRTSVLIADTGSEQSWPEFVEQVHADGIRSMLVVPLVSDQHCIGAIVFYADSAFGLGPESRPVATACARHLESVLSAQQTVKNLQQGMQSRELIGQALGILMERHRLTARQAFDELVYASQTSHVKLREVARVLVTTGEFPPR
jgi:PAS domain S-box-containing protein